MSHGVVGMTLRQLRTVEEDSNVVKPKKSLQTYILDEFEKCFQQ